LAQAERVFLWADRPCQTTKTGPAFDNQLVRRGVLPEALKRKHDMFKDPDLNGSPAPLRQQHLRLLENLPPRPDNFPVRLGWVDELPENHLPKGSPRKPEYVCSVDWNLSSRTDAYYIKRSRRYWLLWLHHYDDGWLCKWVWMLYAYAPKRDVATKDAAIHLLLEGWKSEEEVASTGAFDWVSGTGLLSESDIMSIAREVWPEQVFTPHRNPNLTVVK